MALQLSKDGSVHVTDERVNTVSHTAACVLAILGAVILIAKAATAGRAWHVVGFSVYGTTLIALFAASAAHHGINASPRTEHLLRQFDYFSIFLLIAGTFTPVCLTVARGVMGWSVFGVVWLVAIGGIVIKAARPKIPKWWTLTLYVTMGWLSVALVPDLAAALPTRALLLLAAGGIVYTLGGLIFIFERPNPVPGVFGFHEIWHFIVITGAALHYAFIYRYVLPV